MSSAVPSLDVLQTLSAMEQMYETTVTAAELPQLLARIDERTLAYEAWAWLREIRGEVADARRAIREESARRSEEADARRTPSTMAAIRRGLERRGFRLTDLQFEQLGDLIDPDAGLDMIEAEVRDYLPVLGIPAPPSRPSPPRRAKKGTQKPAQASADSARVSSWTEGDFVLIKAHRSASVETVAAAFRKVRTGLLGARRRNLSARERAIVDFVEHRPSEERWQSRWEDWNNSVTASRQENWRYWSPSTMARSYRTAAKRLRELGLKP